MILLRWLQTKEKISRLRLSPLIWVIVVLFVAACNRNTATPPVPPTAVVTVAPAVSPTAATAAETATVATTVATAVVETPTASLPTTPSATIPVVNGVVVTDDAGGVIFTSPRYSYTLTLPCCWLALPTGTTLGSTLPNAEAQAQNPAWGDLGERIRDIESGAVMELIALLPDAQSVARPEAQLTVSVLPAQGLTLEGYLAATEAELNQIANTTVITAYLEPTLGGGTFPASVIEYTAAPTPANNHDEESIAGYQVAFFGQDENSLIVLTFTTSTERFADLQPQFLQIVHTVAFVEPSA